MVKKICSGFDKGICKISTVFMWISAVALFFMSAVSFVDVVGRYLLHRPLTGAQEIVEVTMSVFVYTGMAMAIRKCRCIAVPVIVEKLSKRVQLLVTSTGNFLCFAMSLILSCQLYLSSLKQLSRMHVGTSVLKVPYAPFYVIVTIGFCVIALELLIVAVKDLNKFVLWNGTPADPLPRDEEVQE